MIEIVKETLSMKRLCKTLCSSFLASVLFAGASASAQQSHITFVVPYSPGGASDQITRVVAERAARELGRTIVVENKPGAAGIVAAQHVLNSAPNGDTLLVGSNAPLVINEGMYDSLAYSPREDFVPVVGLARTPLVMVVNAEHPASNVKEFVEWAGKQNAPVAMGSGGNGNITHLAGVYAANSLEFAVTHVPFQGTAPGVMNLIGGNIDVMFDTLPSSIAQIDSGRLKALAMMDEARWPDLPEIPTLVELDQPKLVASAWFGLVAPKGTPAEAIEAINKAVSAAHADPAVRERLTKIGSVPMVGTAEEFGAFIEREREQWLPVVEETGAKAD